MDDRHLFLHHFVFTRSSPVVHFWVGGDSQQPSPKGQIVPYPPLPNYAAADDTAANEHVARFNQINKVNPRQRGRQRPEDAQPKAKPAVSGKYIQF